VLTTVKREYDFNPDTGAGSFHIEKEIRCEVRGHLFAFTLRLPKYILDKLSESDWNRTMDTMKSKAHDALLNYAAQGYIRTGNKGPVDEYLEKVLSQTLYERFLDHQERAGNAAWAVPEALLT